jgi:single-strand DNA-binding protein
LEAEALAFGCPRKWDRKRRKFGYLLLELGFVNWVVGADPEQRQAQNNGAKFTILSVATQRSWKNAQDEWSSKVEWHRVCVFRPLLAARVAATIKKGAHVLVEGSLVSSTYEQPNGRGKKAKAENHIVVDPAPMFSANSTAASQNPERPPPALRLRRPSRTRTRRFRRSPSAGPGSTTEALSMLNLPPVRIQPEFVEASDRSASGHLLAGSTKNRGRKHHHRARLPQRR